MASHRLTALALTLVVLAASCRNVNVLTDTFATMAEARQRGAVDRGWVPSFLPDQAYELRAAYEGTLPALFG